jgi:outer membrane protein assembly factor BamD (BamD/ComL family)
VKYLGFLLTLLLCAPLVCAQTSPWLTEAEQTRFEELRRSGLDALYNIDYDKANRDFKEIVRLYPNHPGGYQLLAARLWIKTLYESYA